MRVKNRDGHVHIEGDWNIKWKNAAAVKLILILFGEREHNVGCIVHERHLAVA